MEAAGLLNNSFGYQKYVSAELQHPETSEPKTPFDKEIKQNSDTFFFVLAPSAPLTHAPEVQSSDVQTMLASTKHLGTGETGYSSSQISASGLSKNVAGQPLSSGGAQATCEKEGGGGRMTPQVGRRGQHIW